MIRWVLYKIMSDVTDAVRAKYPGAYDNVDDDTLTRAIGDKYPAYAYGGGHPEFAADYRAVVGGVPSKIDLSKMDLSQMPATMPAGDGGSQYVDPDETIAERIGGTGSHAAAMNVYRAVAAAPGAVVNAAVDAIPAADTASTAGGAFGLQLARDVPGAIPAAGRLMLGAMADLASTATGTPSKANLDSFANNDEQMPVEQGLADMHGLGSVPTKAAAGLLKVAPAIGVGGGLALAGAPAAVAAGAPMAFDAQGHLDPYGALIASGLPGVSGAAEKFIGAQLAKLPTAHVVAEVMSRDPLQIKAKVVQQLGGLQIFQ